jgi:hypothetical protein
MQDIHKLVYWDYGVFNRESAATELTVPPSAAVLNLSRSPRQGAAHRPRLVGLAALARIRARPLAVHTLPHGFIKASLRLH